MSLYGALFTGVTSLAYNDTAVTNGQLDENVRSDMALLKAMVAAGATRVGASAGSISQAVKDDLRNPFGDRLDLWPTDVPLVGLLCREVRPPDDIWIAPVSDRLVITSRHVLVERALRHQLTLAKSPCAGSTNHEFHSSAGHGPRRSGGIRTRGRARGACAGRRGRA